MPAADIVDVGDAAIYIIYDLCTNLTTPNILGVNNLHTYNLLYKYMAENIT